ncbi:imidazole glycerol phosphate synthase subunit HisH [Corynebacterium silvaticum]|uniref:Imidazole glycerol phosphate synthase subunit HisH n=1 Tax=Corynebacterium silvaticum TaxID=2320431 RepID=A0A7Y4P730_9CORY|nr:imidazole glycerol phosphate synthase subunit HisH [Corynebacterium silvaticum]ARU46431.1 imidazole glycerol phosphate synthase subunit HisH [Corynebacterium silvaticum]MBH5299573.1 imidazole glycerol phosphate synthase subunit HisH [Corynebacterium silvaticum]NOM64108.1 imidazole glycerol phosphate synthase subunit HisH [Corynebacterium silvaticum]NON69313.1 imidazole glycerol phosphate synthase subunit HisH [Corynebacterium silvaticum]TFA93959.1 imidazole glycerol phosphate synthase subun
MKKVALLDYGSGNLRSAQRALERVGAEVTVTSNPEIVLNADGLLVPGVGAFAACMKGLREIQGDRMIGQRLAGGHPVMGICVGMQIMFEQGIEHGIEAQGCGEWPGTVEKLQAKVLPHMGWNTVEMESTSELFAGLDSATRFYFVHSYGVRNWEFEGDGLTQPPLVTWASHDEDRFVAAVENGPLWATQFHPEKSGDAGAHLLENWLGTL